MSIRYETPKSGWWQKCLGLVLLAGYSLAVPLLFLLLVSAVTARSRIFATAGIALLVFVAIAIRSRRTRQSLVAAGIGTALSGAVLAGILLSAPSGSITSFPRFGHAYPLAAGQQSSLAGASILPEVDQLMIAFNLASWIDPYFTVAQASKLKDTTRQIYLELERDTDFNGAGSAMGEVYRELLWNGTPSRHVYTFVPHSLDQDLPSPVLVFFHGSGGNFKAYTWILAELAERHRMIIVAPSFGQGNWTAAAAKSRWDDALEIAATFTTVDPSRTYAMGLSNGSLAISHLAANRDLNIRGLLFLSPVFESAVLQNASIVCQTKNRAVRVMTGARDNRVPLPYVENSVAVFLNRSVDVQSHRIADADHFLMFTHRDELIAKLDLWLGELEVRH